MPVSRYRKDNIILNPKRLATAEAVTRIRNSIANGTITTSELTLSEGQRLDHLAGKYYGDGRYWWVIAIASGIGWGLQVPPGTRILIPNDLNSLLEVA
jgi:hypothetical protein